MNIKQLLEYGKKLLKENNIEDSNIISRILVEYIFQMDRTKVLLNENKNVDEEDKHRYYLALIEIIQGMPIQYITNNQEFMKLNFYVDENVLIPQPDTEILVEEAINLSNNNKIEILDMCTGSGAIAVSLAKYIEKSKLTASDISKEALKIAMKNAIQNEVKEKIDFINSDMFENITEKYDIIVSNPPYIKTNTIQTLDKTVQNEPNLALDGGEDGLKFYKILVQNSYKYLKQDGYLIMEIGYDQKDEVIKLLNETNEYKEIYSKKDLSENDRIIVCKKK